MGPRCGERVRAAVAVGDMVAEDPEAACRRVLDGVTAR